MHKKNIVLISGLTVLIIVSAVVALKKTGSEAIGNYQGEPLAEIGTDPIIEQMPPDALQAKKERLAELILRLKANPSDFDVWMELGLIKKFFNNYRGAVAVFEYARVLNPANAVVHYNLANLYGIYLRDYPKAEEYYRAAIERAYGLAYTYLGLAEFYRDFYKEKSNLVDDVLLAGLEVIPDDPNLLLNLAFYYKSAGDKPNALKYFRKLINHPDVSGNQQQQIQEEILELEANSR